ncbi:MAG: NlpC/P60 family protein [Ferruginibacter sp.]
MKNLFFVSVVAISIVSGTSMNASAQTALSFNNKIEFRAELPEDISLPPVSNAVTETAAAPEVTTVKPAPSAKSKKAPLITEQCKALHFKFALLLNREVESITNTELFRFINEWWGTRYRYGGTTKRGIDCSAFTGMLMSSVFAFQLPRTARAQYALCKKLKRPEMEEGDLVFFNTRGGISHVGVYLGEGYFVHASSSVGVTISNLDETYWSRRFISGGKINETLLSTAVEEDADCVN